MNKRMRAVAAVLAGLCLAERSEGATVSWGAQNSNGLGESDGTELAAGDLVRLGAFSISDAQIQANQNNLGFLNSSFIEFGAAAIGDDLGVAAHWAKESSGSTDGLGIHGQRIYVWAFNAPTVNAASQHGIFTSSISAWTFPADAAVPNTTSIDLEQAGLAGIVLGGFGVGTSGATSAALYNLAAIPEPHTYGLVFAACGLGVALWRRRSRAS